MIPWPRHRVTAVAVLGFWLGGLLLQAVGVHVPDTADGGLNGVVWSAADTTTTIAAGKAATEEHCGICHLQRAVRSAVVSAATTVALVTTSTTEIFAPSSVLLSSAHDDCSSRAPPSAL
jgi:mono/diheme cytochrome c family protein